LVRPVKCQKPKEAESSETDGEDSDFSRIACGLVARKRDLRGKTEEKTQCSTEKLTPRAGRLNHMGKL